MVNTLFNKVPDGGEKSVFYFYLKTEGNFWPTQYSRNVTLSRGSLSPPPRLLYLRKLIAPNIKSNLQLWFITVKRYKEKLAETKGTQGRAHRNQAQASKSSLCRITQTESTTAPVNADNTERRPAKPLPRDCTQAFHWALGMWVLTV